MRVIAGSLRGRTLTAPPGAERTRPTSDRVREAVFSMLGDVAEASVLDLFAGTGALGIEALSRGAGSAVFVERDRRALTAIRANLRALGLVSPAVDVRARGALAALRAARGRGETYDLVFVDPPYACARELEEPLSASLPGILAAHARVVVESDRRAPLALAALAPLRERRYADTLIAIYSNIHLGPVSVGDGRPPERSGRTPEPERPGAGGRGRADRGARGAGRKGKP